MLSNETIITLLRLISIDEVNWLDFSALLYIFLQVHFLFFSFWDDNFILIILNDS